MGVIFIPTKKTYENLEKMMFSGVGEYGIPEIMPEEYEPCEWIGANLQHTKHVKRKRLSVGRKDEELGKERLIDRTGRILWQT